MSPSLQEKPTWKSQPSHFTWLPSTVKEGPSGCGTGNREGRELAEGMAQTGQLRCQLGRRGQQCTASNPTARHKPQQMPAATPPAAPLHPPTRPPTHAPAHPPAPRRAASWMSARACRTGLGGSCSPAPGCGARPRRRSCARCGSYRQQGRQRWRCDGISGSELQQSTLCYEASRHTSPAQLAPPAPCALRPASLVGVVVVEDDRVQGVRVVVVVG